MKRKLRRPLTAYSSTLLNLYYQTSSKIKLATISVETLYLNGPLSRFVNCFPFLPKQFYPHCLSYV